jgi:hypothetical protein
MKIDQRIKEEMVYIYVDRITYYDLVNLITYRFRRKKNNKEKNAFNSVPCHRAIPK